MRYVLIGKRKPTDGVGCKEFVEMSEELKKEIAIIPAGSHVSIMGCRFALLEDTKVKANQANLDYIIGEQENFENGVGVVGKSST